jgi:APA family basic amino acid/polyamine antiporter
MLLNVVYVFAVSPKEMFGVEEIGGLAALNLFGEKIGSFFGILIAFCLLSAVSSMIMIGPRVYFAMAQDRLFFEIFRGINQKSNIPSYAILLQAGISLILVLTSTFYAILIYVGFVLAVFSSVTVLGMMILRAKDPERPRPYKTWGYPLTPVLFIAGNIWIVIFSIQKNLTAFIWGLVTIVFGCVIYEFFGGRFKKC